MTQAKSHADASIRSARIALVTLSAINLLNYLDRYLIAGIVVPLKDALGANDADIGLLTSVFLLVYMVASPLFGILARRTSRTFILAAGILIWSLATIGSGLVNTLTQLFIMRAIVGIGEAAYTTVGPAMLVDHYSPARRPFALSIFYAAIPVGSALSYIASGLIVDAWGWREVFLAGGVPGIALAIVCLKLKDPPRGQFDEMTSEITASSLHTHSTSNIIANIKTMMKSRDFVTATAGYIAFTFAFGALAVWMPYYLQSARGWSVASSTTTFGIVLVASGFVGTIAGGAVAKRLGGGSASCLKLCGICMAVAAPSSIIALYCQDDWLIILGLTISSAFSFATQGPVNAVILNSVSALLRPFAIGMSVLLIHLLGDVPSPWLVGKISDSTMGIKFAMGLIPIAMAISAVVWFLAGKSRQQNPQRIQ
ncbi:MAG: MFS transporter [Planctomycetota bacterium]|nr:MFS transporter [Planctomycetota bacterium]